MNRYKVHSKEFVMLKCGLVVGPIIEEGEKIKLDTARICDVMVLLENTFKREDASSLAWNKRGKCLTQWMSNGRLDIEERFKLKLDQLDNPT